MTTPNEQPVKTASGIELKVCADIAARQCVGIAKYGMTLEQNPADLKERVTHAYQESLDLPLYLRWILEELDRINLYRAELEAVARAAVKECELIKYPDQQLYHLFDALESLKAKGWKA